MDEKKEPKKDKEGRSSKKDERESKMEEYEGWTRKKTQR